jgi:predicted nucleic acid-binding protein
LIVVDSSVWIANLRNHMTPQVARLIELSGREPLIVGDLVMLEVLQGARDEVHAARIERNLRQYVTRPMLTDEIAVKAARNFSALRASGVTMRKTINLVIGTFCIESGHRLLHDDGDFVAMEKFLGLAVAH